MVSSLLAGFYIAFGAELATVVTSDAATHLGLGVSRLLGGSVFSLGLMLVVICGAELFTGNSLLVKAALQRRDLLGEDRRELDRWSSSATWSVPCSSPG